MITLHFMPLQTSQIAIYICVCTDSNNIWRFSNNLKKKRHVVIFFYRVQRTDREICNMTQRQDLSAFLVENVMTCLATAYSHFITFTTIYNTIFGCCEGWYIDLILKCAWEKSESKISKKRFCKHYYNKTLTTWISWNEINLDWMLPAKFPLWLLKHNSVVSM